MADTPATPPDVEMVGPAGRVMFKHDQLDRAKTLGYVPLVPPEPVDEDEETEDEGG